MTGGITHHAPHVLALDLEGTLVSNAMSQIPRPGLYAFLARCSELFPRIVIYTTVDELQTRKVMRALVADGFAPAWFADIECIAWQGKTKDLNLIPDATASQALLVDDYEIYVHPGQESRWIRVDFFDHPYPEADTGLAKVLAALEARVRRNA